ncbi:MAG: sugar ABC transporter permease [Actinomycetaceae bacterium]|nr:sugar ABC transporter permease [Actinomycetaceae bacterium]MDY6082504.1 sugar ABC transporter permease [Actinomycetaceae bacterium]
MVHNVSRKPWREEPDAADSARPDPAPSASARQSLASAHFTSEPARPHDRPAEVPTGVGSHRRARAQRRAAILFILPAGIGFVFFFLSPTLQGIYYSFTQYNILGKPRFIGTANFVKLLHDPLFWNAMKITLWYVVLNIGFQTIIALGLAVLMQRLTRSILIRSTLLLPWLVSNVIAALVWFWMLDYQIGIVNIVLEHFGLDKIAFFADSHWAIPTIAFVNVWRYMGYTALLIFAGLVAIPENVYEAAALDGCTPVKAFFKVTLPLLRPVLAMVLVLSITGSFQVFDTVAVTTRGGPVNVTRVIQYYIWQKSFAEGQFGYGAALSTVLFVILAVVAFVQIKLMRANESDLA